MIKYSWQAREIRAEISPLFATSSFSIFRQSPKHKFIITIHTSQLLYLYSDDNFIIVTLFSCEYTFWASRKISGFRAEVTAPCYLRKNCHLCFKTHLLFYCNLINNCNANLTTIKNIVLTVIRSLLYTIVSLFYNINVMFWNNLMVGLKTESSPS